MDSLRHVPIPLALYNFSITACENFHNYNFFLCIEPSLVLHLTNYKRTQNANTK